MTGIYFSGTGNSRYCTEKFLQACSENSGTFSIEDTEVLSQIRSSPEIVIGYPVQYSDMPRILKDFIVENSSLWNGKKIFVIATMGMFSGDGSGVVAMMLKRYGAVIVCGLHVKMPDSICDEKVLKKTLEENKKLIANADKKIVYAAKRLQSGSPTKEGLSVFSQMAGLFGQRLLFHSKTDSYSDKLKIDGQKCIGCGKCEKLCPMKNIRITDSQQLTSDKCTMCYRCINQCPTQAITLLGKKIIKQGGIEKYL